MAKKRESLDAKSKELDKLKNKQIAELAMTGMTEEEAKEQMIQALKDKAKLDAQVHIQNTMEEATSPHRKRRRSPSRASNASLQKALLRMQ